ncbi:MAG: ATP phosphoribosyltransferase [Candidatus Nanopelagicales bacterium]|jgi:ATP phosphoribosyltransferase|nr:ATP phosphoribosyltransferase [Candidatus Nanopelagicales bacterium]MDP4715771.1 ATP phosphoribosyltransferase [Candidatus Nanopelagicales bacterium]MDP4906188.1 ATP phosphoribosyltransferase [Candidatus Nanopelagicales bacterium]MDP4975003.1 ATP phosphoribosyltransferase [Candidatus Nanopelagicales bacterium]MDP5096060.1 ATP phosphoribosyltransferase [Candidatus Nanopelagicales bacterium]
MLRVALPNKGQLAEPSREILREAGYLRASAARDLVVQDPDNDVEFFFLRPKDIAIYVGEGTLDLGITGRDMLLDSGAEAVELVELGFGGSTFRLAAAPGSVRVLADLSGLRIATSYPGILTAYLRDNDVQARIVRLDGAVENAVRLGVADAVADVVATGTTLRMAGLEVVGEPILVSEALVVRRSGAPEDAAVDTFVRRLHGVMVARSYVLVDYDIRADQVDAACAITPGFESPTVSSLHDPAWVAVRAMVPRRDVHGIMDELYELGARGILVTAIHASRL